MENNTAAFSVYAPNGVKVFITLALASEFTDDSAKAIHAAIGVALANGFMVNAVGLEANEEREDIGWVLRYNHVNDRDGSITPRIFFYPANEQLVRKDCSHYLNTEEDVAEFERVSGLKVNALPAWLVGGAPNRDDANARAFVIPVKNPFAVVKKPNKKYQGEGDKKNTKYEFVRYESKVVGTLPPTQTVRPSDSAQTEPTSNRDDSPSVQGTNGVKVVNGEDQSVMDELFGARVEKATPDTVWTMSSPYFNARAHFNNWWNKHLVKLEKLTLTEAIAFVRFERWNHDKNQVKKMFEWAQDHLGLGTSEVMDALSFANRKPLTKVSAWESGDMNVANAALFARHAGYNLAHLLEITNAVDSDTVKMAEDMCREYARVNQEKAG